MAKYIRFQKTDQEYEGKPVYEIVNKRSGACIGQVFWYKPWRRWCARFKENSVWSEDCLNDVRFFMGGSLE